MQEVERSMKWIDEVKPSESHSIWFSQVSKGEFQASNPGMQDNYTKLEKCISTPPSKAALRKFFAEGVVNKHLVGNAENELPSLYQKYRDFQFESPFKEFNRYPPEFKACLA